MLRHCLTLSLDSGASAQGPSLGFVRRRVWREARLALWGCPALSPSGHPCPGGQAGGSSQVGSWGNQNDLHGSHWDTAVGVRTALLGKPLAFSPGVLCPLTKPGGGKEPRKSRERPRGSSVWAPDLTPARGEVVPGSLGLEMILGHAQGAPLPGQRESGPPAAPRHSASR